MCPLTIRHKRWLVASRNVDLTHGLVYLILISLFFTQEAVHFAQEVLAGLNILIREKHFTNQKYCEELT